MGWKTRRKADGAGTEATTGDSAETGTGTAVAERDEPRDQTPGGAPTGSTSATHDARADQPDDERGDQDRSTPPAGRRTGVVARSWPWLLLRASHPLRAVLTALGLAGAVLIAGRETREALVVLATVLVGQAVLGWHNDLVDRGRDARRAPGARPLTTEHLEPGTVWFALTCAVLLVVPLSVSTGVVAGVSYLLSVAAGLLGNVALRRGRLSWLPWAVAFGLYPAYVSYGGWGGQALGEAPSVLMTLLAAALGVGVHVLGSSYDLVADHDDGWRTLPVRLGLRLGASRLLAVSIAWTALVLLAMAVVGATGGLAR